ncbi:chondroitinase-B domain-containing protein [Chryseobacterium gotjawalense]|uniref:Chondroitinase-B domain-containing protein n=1 Tax=Chryseobacterium gotjawalense TaxID=3042315 RepID=A0ABY8REK6_9FLAO|nr:chondroitinase-B domain-containing protein [Chryseobacterium sp. wdc7]WHF51472.1 chondroitinase-B domain-containing protein [Chryseobacterium sp. wdc7]
MKNSIRILSLVILLFTCNLMVFANPVNSAKDIKVKNIDELNNAIKNSTAGDQIVLANGIWKDVQIRFYGTGTKENPIVLRGETPGKVFIEGASDLKFGGNYLTVRDLHFRNGYTPSSSVVSFKIDNNTIANNCKFTQCVIEEFTQPDRDVSDHWIEFWGRHNELSNSYITGKSNFGPTLRVFLDGNENIYNYHQIVNNYFGPRPRKGGPHGETIQVGDSETSMAPSHTNVYNNLFDQCNGEVEVISNKSNFNEYRNNIFLESEGSLVIRHGNYNVVDGNIFIGNDKSNQIGGIRVVNTGHWITNNYFYKIRGEAFRSAISIMNGIPKSSLNRYNQVTDVVVAHNSFVDCVSPWQLSVGSNVSQSAVLPKSEIRSARPERVLFANNLIYNELPDTNPIVNYDKVDGVTFKNNFINNVNNSEVKPAGLITTNFGVTKVSDGLFTLKENNTEVYHGFDFENITKDLFGNSRTGANNSVGAIVNPVKGNPLLVDRSKYGTDWYEVNQPNTPANKITVSTAGELAKRLEKASSGDIILLRSGTYHLKSSLPVNKQITIASINSKNKAKLVFTSEKTAFEMQPKGHLILKEIILTGNKTQNAFTTLDKLMSKAYDISIENSEISNFKSVLEVSKGSFADNISLVNSKISNCENGFMLNKEKNDGGDYNAEFVTFTNSKFDHISGVILDYYRGGYDESTIGGNIKMEGNTITNSGKAQPENILIKNRGIVNVSITNNVFKNNPVKTIAVLWGEKGQTPGKNTIEDSGEFKVVQNLEMKLMY